MAKPTSIPAQRLDTALQALAKERGLTMAYRSEIVGALETNGAKGKLTRDEALSQLLNGTGLTFKYIDTDTVTIVPSITSGAFERAPVAPALAERDVLKIAQNSASAATAQDERSASSSRPAAAAQAAGQETLDGIPEVFVTGSRSLNMDIVRTVDDAQAYYILDKDVIEKSGSINVEDFLKRRLTMNTTVRDASQAFVGALGSTSSVNLRGLGATQTLILINGRRTSAVGLEGSTNQPNLNGIPLAAVERIEVLPASSAAIYGGSAVGGVVNVVLKSDYTGGQVKAVYDNTFDTNAGIFSVDAAYGFSLEEDRTHVLLSGHYSQGNALLARDRPQLMLRGINAVLRNNPSYLYSDSRPFLGATPNITSVDGSDLVFKGGAPLGAATTFVPFGLSPGTAESALNAALRSNAGLQNLVPPDTANSYGGNLNSQGATPDSKAFVGSVHREMTDSLRVFLEFSYARSLATWNSTPLLFPYIRTVPGSAPTNPFDQDVNVTLVTPRITDYVSENISKRATAGFIFDLPRRWKMEGDYTWNANTLRYSSGDALSAAVDADLASGALNPFIDQVAYPVDLSSYLGGYRATNPSELENVGLRFMGPLFALPAGNVTLVAGLEHRKEGIKATHSISSYPNHPEADEDLLYLPQSQTINSIYLETNVPLVKEGEGRAGLRMLDVQLAGRMEKYDVGTGTAYQYLTGPNVPSNPALVRFNKEYTSTNPTFGLRYRPFDDLMLRASYSRAFIVPTYSQLMPPIDESNTAPVNVNDPRRDDELVGVQQIFGGNQSLEPQTSANWNFGLVFTPGAVPGLRMALDWYRIEQQHIIITPTRDFILANEASFPGRVIREAAAPGDPFGVGPIQTLDLTLFNANHAETEGLDLSFDWRKPTDRLGTFSLSALATYVRSYKIQTGPGLPLVEMVNQVAARGPIRFKGNAVLNWEYRDWTAGWATTYYGSYPQYAINGITTYVDTQGSDRIPRQMYHDIYASYHFDGAQGQSGGVRGALEGVTLQIGIKNVFDKTPPLDVYYGRFSGYYYSPFGDPRLRSYWLSLTKEF